MPAIDFLTFEHADQYPVAILIKSSSFQKGSLDASYVKPLQNKGIARDSIIACALPYNASNKAPVKHIKSFLDTLLCELVSLGVTTLYCADAAFFKVITGMSKAETYLGYTLPGKYLGYERFKVVLGVNHTSLIYNPLNENKLNMSLNALHSAITDSATQFETPIIRQACYPQTDDTIAKALRELHQHPELAVDIETFSLQFDKAGIGTIAFSWNTTDGVAFAVDYQAIPEYKGVHGKQVDNPKRKQLLREFFSTYQGRLRFHRANFDIKVLIYELYMDTLADTKGLLDGLHTLCRAFDDTRIVAYLALNSTAGNDLKLKTLAHEYAGNYAVDEINDITRICLPDLLEYNLVDTCCTNYVYDRYYSQLVADDQQSIYDTLMLPSLKTIIQMELTGMPINPKRVQEVRHQLEIIRSTHEHHIRVHPAIVKTEAILTEREYEKDYQSRLAKAKKPEAIKYKDRETFPTVRFNPNSPLQLQTLIYEVLDLPVLEKTRTGQAATGSDVIEKLVHHVTNESDKALFDALIGYAGAEKILSTFIVAFEKAIAHSPDDPRVYLHGSFNLGGAVSGRLSSSEPNLQNLPNNSVYGKLIKSCFQAAAKDLFVGADFNSLEAMINALTTKDPNKLAVYINHYDSHSWNAFGYWPEKMPDIARRMKLAEQPGKFYKRLMPNGQYQYYHESEL